MRIFLFILFFIFYTKNVCAQQTIVDSLSQLLKKETNPISKIDLHLGLSRAYNFTGKYDLIEKHLNIANQLSEDNDYKKGQGIILLCSSVLDYHNGQGAEIAYTNSIKAKEIAQLINSKSLETMADYHLAEYYIYEKNNYTKGIEILNQSIAEIDKTVPDKHIGNIYKTLAQAFEIQGKDSLATQTFEKALHHFDRVRTHPFIVPELGRPEAMEADKGLMNKGQVHIYLGRIHSAQGDMEKALSEMHKAKDIYEQTASQAHIAWAVEESAKVYSDFGVFEKAIENFQIASKVYEKINLIPDQIDVLLELGRIFTIARDFDVAEEYYLKSLENMHQATDTVLIVDIYSNLANLNIQKKRPNLALENLYKAEKLNSAIQDSSMFAQIQTDIGRVFTEKQEYQKSNHYQHQAKKWSLYFQNSNDLFYSYIFLSINHFELNQLDSALSYVLLAKESVQDNYTIERRLDVKKLTSKIYEKQKDYKKALVFKNDYFEDYEQLFSANAQQKLKEEQVRQNVVDFQKEKELAEREAILLSQRNQLYLILAIALLGIILVGSYLFNQLRKVKQQLESQNQQLQQLNATKDKFFGIIAHDIRSPIVALDGVGEQMEFYLKKNKTDKLQRLAGRVDTTAKRLSALLDNLLNWALLQQGVIPYHPKSLKIKNLGEDIFHMFQTNAETKKITLNLQIDEQQKVFADESALNTILRNLISNAIKFTPEGGKVSLSTETKNDKVFIKINDTGTGISAEKLSKLFSLEKKSEKGTAGEKGTGLGLTLVKELADLNKGSINVNNVL